MNAPSKASRDYLRNSVLTASPERLQLMLYDAAIKYASQGREALARQDYEGAFNGFDRAQQIVRQLATGLNRDVNPGLVDQMAALYDFILRRMIDANAHREPAAADEAIGLLRHMRETWDLLITRLAEEVGKAAPAIENVRQADSTPSKVGNALRIEG